MIIVGAGKTGAFLAEKLHGDHDVTVVEQRRDRVEYVRSLVPEATVIEGDACEPDILETAGVEDVDLVAAVTGDDEDNLVVAMLAKLYRAKTVYGRVNHPRNEWLFDDAWGVDVAVSSPQVLYGLIEKDIGFGDLVALLKLKAEGVYLEELTLPESATKIGKRLADIALPSNVNVMAILAADGYIQAPRGDTPLVAGDQLLLLVEGGLEEAVIREAFGIRDAGPATGTESGHD
jgi:trk system potassium uptake protein TrkA